MNNSILQRGINYLTDDVIHITLREFCEVPNSGLKAYFGRVEEGNPLEYRTPFAGKRPLTEVLREWDQEFNRWFPRSSEFLGLLQFEHDMREKVGPLSIMKPLRQRITDVKNYYELIKVTSQPISYDAVCKGISKFAIRRDLYIKSISNTLNDMKLSTNSGTPYFKRKKLVAKDTIPFKIIRDLRGMNLKLIQSLRSGSYYMAAIIGWRGQEGGLDDNDVKQRVVWMMPFTLNIAELSLYQVFISYCQSMSIVPAWISNEEVDRNITKLFDTKSPRDYILCTDFEKFDQHFNYNMQSPAKIILSKCFSKDTGIRSWIKDIFPIKYEIPMLVSDNQLFTGYHGMASGSGGTNVDETISHTCLQFEAAICQNTELNRYSMCLGDDGLLSYPKIDIDTVLKVYTSKGQEMNVEKQKFSQDDCVYLRRWHSKYYRPNGVCAGVYSTYRALGRLCEQERFYDPSKWSKEMVALRYLSILENVKWHPCKEKFADFCIKRDKYRLGIDIPGFLDNLYYIASKSIDMIHDFMGYNIEHMSEVGISGISTWWIVKYLKSKA